MTDGNNEYQLPTDDSHCESPRPPKWNDPSQGPEAVLRFLSRVTWLEMDRDDWSLLAGAASEYSGKPLSTNPSTFDLRLDRAVALTEAYECTEQEADEFVEHFPDIPANVGTCEILEFLTDELLLPQSVTTRGRPGHSYQYESPPGCDVLARLDRAPLPHRLVVADHPLTCGEVLTRLAALDEERDEGALEQTSSTPAEDSLPMGLTGHPIVRETVARNPNVPAEVLAAFAVNRDPEIRVCAAMSPQTPDHLLFELASDNESSIRSAVASNPSTSDATQRRLLANALREVPHDMELLYRMAFNPSATGSFLHDLAREVMWAPHVLVFHPNIETRTLARLMAAKSPRNRDEVWQQLVARCGNDVDQWPIEVRQEYFLAVLAM